jgi:membrane-bound inhibitor of C-type lysozyme
MQQSLLRYDDRLIPSVLRPKFQAFVGPGHRVAYASWAKPSAFTPQVFVSDFNEGTITCFDLAGSVLGQITGLINPQGMALKYGQLYIAETGAHRIDIIHIKNTCNPRIGRTLDDPGQYPVDVVVDNGTVFASNIFGTAGPSTAPGSITYWTGGNSTPAGNFNAGASEYENFFLGLDASGNLYSNWRDSSFIAHTSCFPSPAGPGNDLGLTVGFPGGVDIAANGDLLELDQGVGLKTYFGGGCTGGWTLSSRISSDGDDWVDVSLRPGNGLVAVSNISTLVGQMYTYPAGLLTTTFEPPDVSSPNGIATTGWHHT